VLGRGERRVAGLQKEQQEAKISKMVSEQGCKKGYWSGEAS
jgi:hypothetical protein